MMFNVDVYRNSKGEKSVFVFSDAITINGKEYKFETGEDIGKAVTNYVEENFPEIIQSPEKYEFVPEEEIRKEEAE